MSIYSRAHIELIILAVPLLLVGCSTVNLQQRHSEALSRHVYIADQEQYGREDVWRSSLRGDCEDYALWMRERVGGQLLYVRTQDGRAHIVLDVDGLVVDNLSSNVYPVEEMKHKLIFALTEKHVEQFMRPTIVNNSN